MRKIGLKNYYKLEFIIIVVILRHFLFFCAASTHDCRAMFEHTLTSVVVSYVSLQKTLMLFLFSFIFFLLPSHFGCDCAD